MKYLLLGTIIFSLYGCSHPDVPVSQDDDKLKSCYEIENETKEITILAEETDFREDIIARSKELDRLYIKKNCY